MSDDVARPPKPFAGADCAHASKMSIGSVASSSMVAEHTDFQPLMSLVKLDAMMAAPPKDLGKCSSIEIQAEGGTISGSADLNFHPVEHADELLSAQEARGPRHGIRAFQDASVGGKRHVLMLPVNALVKGLNHVATHDPLLEGWMGVSPPELARYMLWAGYDTLLLQQVPVLQSSSSLGRWKYLEGFILLFARAWEAESKSLLDDADKKTDGGRNPAIEGMNSSTMRTPGDRAYSDERPGDFQFAATSPGARRTVNPLLTAFRGGAAVSGQPEPGPGGNPGFWPPYIRVHTAQILVENGDAFVHHAFTSRDVERPWWWAVKGIVMRNRHLDVKGLYSHSYASEVYKSRTQILTFVESYVEDEDTEELEETIANSRTLWSLPEEYGGRDAGKGRGLAVFAIEEVNASIEIDPIEPPSAFRRVAVGEEFTEADTMMPRPFSSVDIGHFLSVMQTKSIPALVSFSLPPALSALKIFRGRQEPTSMVQYLSHPTFAIFEPNMPRVSAAAEESQKAFTRGASVNRIGTRDKGVRWADQHSEKKPQTVFDPLTCPNLDAFLDAVTNERQRTGAVEWSTEGEEESDWIEAVVAQLRNAKREAKKVTKAKADVRAIEENRRSANVGLMGDIGSEISQAVPAGAGSGSGEVGDGGAGTADAEKEVPEWIVQQLPGLLDTLEACRHLVHDSTLLRTMVDASQKMAKGNVNDPPGVSGTPGHGNTPSRARNSTPSRGHTVVTRSNSGTPNRVRGTVTPWGSGAAVPRSPGVQMQEDGDVMTRNYEEEALPMHWTEVERLGKSDTLRDPGDGPELLEDQVLCSYLEYSVGQPRLGTRCSPRVQDMVLSNIQYLIDSGTLTPIHYDKKKCGPVKSDIFKEILARFSALAYMLHSTRKAGKEKDKDGGSNADSKDFKDLKAAVHALLARVSVSQIYACMSALAVAGGAAVPRNSESNSPSIEVYVVEKGVMTFTGEAESEEHFAFHALYKETTKGFSVYVTKEHPNQAAAVLWCYLKAKGMPVMMCHLTACLMDRTLDCRWDSAHNDSIFHLAALKEGAMRLTYMGDFRPMSFLSETCKEDINESLPILERAALLRMLAHGHACLAEYSAAGVGEVKSRSELAASFRIISAWRMAIVQNLRNTPSSRYLYKFVEHLRLPSLTIVGSVIGHEGIDPRNMLWWTWLAIPWSPSARTVVTNLLTVIARAPPPRVSAATAVDNAPLSKSARRRAMKEMDSEGAKGTVQLAGLKSHGALWRVISDLFVTRLGTCMLVRSLVLENRDESPYPPNEKHYHMVALELRGADKTAVFDYLRTDTETLGEVMNRIVRKDCLAADHSAAFLDSKSLGTLHNVKHGKSGKEPMWLLTGYGGRLRRMRDIIFSPKDSSVIHGYGVGMYYSMPVLIELLLQLTSDRASSIYTNSEVGKFETIVPIALLHSLVFFGGLSLGAAKISSVNFFSFMVIKLVLAQIQFMTVLIVASVIMLPFVVGGAVILWWEDLELAATFVGVFYFVGFYIMLVSLMLATTGGKPWSALSGRIMLLAHALLLISPALSVTGLIATKYENDAFLVGVGMLMVTLVIGFTFNIRRIYNMTLTKQTLMLSDEEWAAWKEEHKDNADPVALFYKTVSSSLTAWRHPLTRKRRWFMLDEDLEQFLLGFDAIRSAQAVPKRWCKAWDDRLKRGHEALVAVNRGAGVETASTMWAMVKWDVLYGGAYFLMVFSDNMTSIWTEKTIVESDNISMLALALFIVATAGLESMMMVNLQRSNGWRFWRMEPEVLSMSDASKSVSNALHKLYLWDFATYTCFVLMCTLVVSCLGYFWLIADLKWTVRAGLRAVNLVVGYVGILVGLFHKILFGGSVSRQKASFAVSAASLVAGYSLGLSLVAANYYLGFSDQPMAYATLGFTGFFYAVFSMFTYRKFRVQLTSQGFASGQLLSTPSLGTAGQRCLGVATLHLDGMEARATESCRSAVGGRIMTKNENRNLITRTMFANAERDPGNLWTKAPRSLRTAFGNKIPRNDDFLRWRISPVPDKCLLDHGFNALVDPEEDDVLYVAESVYADREAFAECLMHETYEWAYGSHQVGVLAELLRDPLPSRMRRQIAADGTRLPFIVDRTLPCSVDVMSMGSLKNEMYWRDLSPHARELVLRMLLTQLPAHFRHVDSPDPSGWQMSFVIEEEQPIPTRNGETVVDPYSDLTLAMRLGCRTGAVLGAAMEEVSMGLEPQVVVARTSLLAGLSQCVMRYALAHISANPQETAPVRRTQMFLGRDMSTGHLQGRQRVWGATMAARNRSLNRKKNTRLSNVEAMLDEMGTVFPTMGAFHLDYFLFGAASGCMGFDREAFALMLDQDPVSLLLFVKMHRVSHWLYKKLLNLVVLRTDPIINDLMKDIDAADVSGAAPQSDSGPTDSGKRKQGTAEEAADAQGNIDAVEEGTRSCWLVDQRKSLEGIIRNGDLPIAFSQWLDQRVLRREPLLADYWEARDKGKFLEALVSLKLVERDLVVGLLTGAAAGLSTYEDLSSFAKCGSSIGMMKADKDNGGVRRSGVPGRTSHGTWASSVKESGGVCVVAMDSGTWPLYGGGVAVCRKQLIDETVGRVRWNTLFEVALPAPLPKNVDIPENIRQVMPVPLWSQNAGGAYETFLAHTSFITRSLREARTTTAAINAFFVPQLKTLIDLANTPGDSVSVDGLEVAAAAVAEIYSYFQVFDWETTWKAGTTHDHWAASWLACAARDKQMGPLLNSEKPNLAELHEILNYWQTLLTCLQVQLPEMNPDNRGVIHVSHHGTQALVGVAAKRLSGWALVVWDHGMLWRERCKAIAELHSSSIFVRKSLISLHRLVAKVVLYESDTLTPCTQMNKPWEMRVISEKNSEVRDVMSRKVNPVLNGAPASILPNEFLAGLNADNKNEWVTVVMLSHVYALKGVMTAIQAADVIVHRYGLTKYRILIYGSTTHDVVYCRRCQDTIDRLKLNENVKLMGKGRPAAVLAQGDMFLNSSVSEGLPLAIIEASRAGLVVVATDVGGTRDVVSEFGGICMPNSPLELAKTELETLAACKKWCKIGGAPNLAWSDIDLSPNPAQILEKAIFDPDVINARHDWGTRYLEWTSKAFTLDRYRDEHVRALWFADRQAQINCTRLTLGWGPDPGQKNLALAYLKLRRMLDVADRKEHTALSFITHFGKVRERMKEEMGSSAPLELSTDPDQLALMASFQTVTSDIPLLLWLHGGKTPWDEEDDLKSDIKSTTSSGGGLLHRIEERQDEDETDTVTHENSSATVQGSASGFSKHQPKYSDGNNTAPNAHVAAFEEDYAFDSNTSDASRKSSQSQRSHDSSIAKNSHSMLYSRSEVSGVLPPSLAVPRAPGTSDISGSSRRKGLLFSEMSPTSSVVPSVDMASSQDLTDMVVDPMPSMAQRVTAGFSPRLSGRGRSAGGTPGVGGAAPNFRRNDSYVSSVGSMTSSEALTNEHIRLKLEKLQHFEKLDERLSSRVGIHLAEVGSLSTPTLAKLLRDAFPLVSPAAKANPIVDADTCADTVTTHDDNIADMMGKFNSIMTSDFVFGSNDDDNGGSGKKFLANESIPALVSNVKVQAAAAQAAVLDYTASVSSMDFEAARVPMSPASRAGAASSGPLNMLLDGYYKELAPTINYDSPAASEVSVGPPPAANPGRTSRSGQDLAAEMAERSSGSIAAESSLSASTSAIVIDNRASLPSKGDINHAATVSLIEGETWVSSPMHGKALTPEQQGVGTRMVAWDPSGSGGGGSRGDEEGSTFSEEPLVEQEDWMKYASNRRRDSIEQEYYDASQAATATISTPGSTRGTDSIVFSGKDTEEARNMRTTLSGSRRHQSIVTSAATLLNVTRNSKKNRPAQVEEIPLPRRRAQIQQVIYPREETRAKGSIEPVSVAVRKHRAHQRRGLISAMASSQDMMSPGWQKALPGEKEGGAPQRSARFSIHAPTPTNNSGRGDEATLRPGNGLGTPSGDETESVSSRIPSAWSPGSSIAGDHKAWSTNMRRPGTPARFDKSGSEMAKLGLPPELERPPILVRKSSGEGRSYRRKESREERPISSKSLSGDRPVGTVKEALTRKESFERGIKRFQRLSSTDGSSRTPKEPAVSSRAQHPEASLAFAEEYSSDEERLSVAVV